MEYELVIKAQAEEDIDIAVEYYKSQSGKLVQVFLEDLSQILINLELNPLIYQKRKGEIRKAPIRKFSYGVYYLVENSIINVIAILHDKQNPRTWQKRNS